MPFHPDEFPPAVVEENPVLSPALSSTAYDWPDQLVDELEAMVAAKREGGEPS